jgi:7-cyano-7-deazaguanine synthase in queuosine biosynthesis
MKVNISIARPNNPYDFARIILSYGATDITEVELNIRYRNLFEFTGREKGVAFDLFLISSLVYGIDILLSREKNGFDGWSRKIEVIFPVEDVDVFVNGKEALEKTLNFLTGDIWTVSFENREVKSLYKYGKKQKVYSDTFRKRHKIVNLFSGGMDSLIGAINQLHDSKEEVCLVSHTDSMFKGSKIDQKNILREIKKKYRHFHHIPTRVDMGKHDVHGETYNKETTLRSRSFLFLSMAVLVADSIDGNMPVHIPENGSISLNYPLTPSRRSSCSTRTTHPHFLQLMEAFLQSIGLNHPIINDYQTYTKGEMAEGCKDRKLLCTTYPYSCSCGKRGTRKDIRDDAHAPHCGVCMPCIYRRAALHKIGVREDVGTDIFNAHKREVMDIPDMPALVSYLTRQLSLSEIKVDLLVNGSLPLGKLDEFANVVMRTREEIKQWVREEAPDEVKRLFGV